MMRTTSHCVCDEEHPALDQTDGVEAQLVGCVAIVDHDHVWIQEHLGGRPKVQAVLCAVGLLLGVVPLELHRLPPLPNILIFSSFQGTKSPLGWQRKSACAAPEFPSCR